MESFDSLGEFVDLDLLDHLGDAMLLNDKLLFLGNLVMCSNQNRQGMASLLSCTCTAKYREYHTFHERKELVKAGDLLVSLLVSDSVPQR